MIPAPFHASKEMKKGALRVILKLAEIKTDKRYQKTIHPTATKRILRGVQQIGKELFRRVRFLL